MDEAFWFAISFVIFVILTYRPVKKAILCLLDSEILRIKKELEASEKLRLEAEKRLRHLQTDLANVKSQREAILQDAKEAAQEVLEVNKRELELMIDRKERDALNSLEDIGRHAESDLRNALTQATKTIAEEYATTHKGSLPSDSVIAARLIA